MTGLVKQQRAEKKYAQAWTQTVISQKSVFKDDSDTVQHSIVITIRIVSGIFQRRSYQGSHLGNFRAVFLASE